MNLSKSREFFDPVKVTERIHIIGCGSVGSSIAELLARLGLEKISLYDFDEVEEKNLANQMFFESDIGKNKAIAVRDLVWKINQHADIRVYQLGWQPGIRLSGYVFLCVDNIETRKSLVNENKYNNTIKAMFDIRTRLLDAQHYAADWRNPDSIKNLLASMDFTHQEAVSDTPTSACGTVLGVAPTVRIITAEAVCNFVNFVKTGDLKKMVFTNGFSFMTEAY